MKTFRLIGMALFAVLMCVNFAACSSDDDPTEEPGKEEGGVVVSGKKLTKIVGKSGDGPYSETYTFSYDNKGRLIEAIVVEEEIGYKDTETYRFTWGDDAIKTSWTSNNSSSSYSCTLILKNGLVQYEDYGDNDGVGTYTYNSSNRLIKFSDDDDYWTTTAIWDGDKLVSISDSENNATLKYGNSCKKGYFPFVATMMEAGESVILFIAHPEIAGMRTTQLPTSLTWADEGYGETTSETTTMEYELDKEGYISKIIGKKKNSDGSTEAFTYTLTWQ